MTTAHTLDLQEPLPHQVPIFDATQRFKVVRAGRRFGKSRAAWVAGMIGHGPGWYDFKPMHEGVAQGWDVVWLAPDYPQAKAIWNEDVRPRSEHLDKDTVKLNNSEFVLKLQGGGALHVRSAEAIKSLRGLGANLKGIIIDEGAWMDLRSHWRSVIRPILMDNNGWAIIASTTNSGLDGNVDHLAPSFFNIICQEIADGTRASDEWIEFYGTAEDNPAIDPAEFQSLVKEYPSDSVQLGQEVYAKLLAAGAGLAFPEWNQKHHVQASEVPADWTWFAAMDWGYADPCAVIFFAAGQRDIIARAEIYVSKKKPYDVGFLVGQKAAELPGRIAYVVAGSDMWDVRDGGETIAEKFQEGLSEATKPEPIGLMPVARGSGSRKLGKLAIHDFLGYEAQADGTIPPWSGAKLRVHPECVNLIRTLPARPIDPKNSEDVEEGGDDHCYDALRYGLTSRLSRPAKQKDTRFHEDQHPGFNRQGERRRPKKPIEDRLIEEAGKVEPSWGYRSGMRYGGPMTTADEL